MATSLGVDIGGSGIKGAVVDIGTGTLVTDRLRIPTPQPSTPDAVAETVAEIVRHFDWTGGVGVTFPAIVRRGVILTAANVDDRWIGVDADAVFTERTGCQVAVLNDADAAGIAEIRVGAGRGRQGVVLVLTFGTGIGSGLFVDGVLVPNTELGHLELDGAVAEHRAAGRVKDEEGLSYTEWGTRVSRYLSHLERLFAPDLFIIGGGISKKFDQFRDVLDVDAPVLPAALRNQAGIVGAAMVASRE
jgi:polyphosphate glucokinase